MFKVINQLRSLFSKVLWSLVIMLGGYAFIVLPVSASPFAYVTNRDSNDVSVIDTGTNTVMTSIAVGNGPLGIAITPDGKRVYVANSHNDNVSVIDTGTNTVVMTIPVGWFPMGVAITPDGKRAYVTNSNSDNMSVIDTSNNSVVTSLFAGLAPIGVAITPDGNRVYVVSDGRISIIDTMTNSQVGYIPGGTSKVAITPDGKHAYVTNSFFNGVLSIGNVLVIDTATNTVVVSIPVGGGGVAITPDGKRVYVTNFYSDDISVIDTSTNTVSIPSISVGDAPSDVAITPDGKRVYVTNSASNDVSVIDTTTNTVVDDPIMVGIAPLQVAISPLPTSINTDLKIKNLMIDQQHKSIFMLSKFALSKNSNGINPTNEAVILKVGNNTMTIPAGAFKEKYHGLFTYVGQIDNVWIKAFIKPLGHNRFGFQVAAYGAGLSGINNPVAVELTIGDDSGIGSVNAFIKQNYDTHEIARGHKIHWNEFSDQNH